jgi:hypothetical protein
MSVIVLTGGPGAPGITTTALGLTLCWPSDVMLSDCDRDPAQAIPAGYLRGLDLGGRGLAVLARLHRETRDIGPELISQTIALTEGETPSRRFLPGFAQPGAVRLFDHIWPELAEAFAGLGSQGIDVIVDAGRLGHEGLPIALLEVADAIGFVLQSNLKSLAASRLYLPLLVEQVGSLPSDRPLGLMLVGPDRPYSAHEITAQFGVECWARIPWDPRPAEVLSHGLTPPRRFRNSSLLGSYRVVALHLTQQLERARALRHELIQGGAP